MSFLNTNTKHNSILYYHCLTYGVINMDSKQVEPVLNFEQAPELISMKDKGFAKYGHTEIITMLKNTILVDHDYSRSKVISNISPSSGKAMANSTNETCSSNNSSNTQHSLNGNQSTKNHNNIGTEFPKANNNSKIKNVVERVYGNPKNLNLVTLYKMNPDLWSRFISEVNPSQIPSTQIKTVFPRYLQLIVKAATRMTLPLAPVNWVENTNNFNWRAVLDNSLYEKFLESKMGENQNWNRGDIAHWIQECYAKDRFALPWIMKTSTDTSGSSPLNATKGESSDTVIKDTFSISGRNINPHNISNEKMSYSKDATEKILTMGKLESIDNNLEESQQSWSDSTAFQNDTLDRKQQYYTESTDDNYHQTNDSFVSTTSDKFATSIPFDNNSQTSTDVKEELLDSLVVPEITQTIENSENTNYDIAIDHNSKWLKNGNYQYSITESICPSRKDGTTILILVERRSVKGKFSKNKNQIARPKIKGGKDICVLKRINLSRWKDFREYHGIILHQVFNFIRIIALKLIVFIISQYYSVLPKIERNVFSGLS